MRRRSSSSVRPEPGLTFVAPRRSPRTQAQFEAFLGIFKASNLLTAEIGAVLKARDLSLAQYNVLRILRGAGPSGATCGQIADRLIQRDPDVTRLVDRLDRRGLAERSRDGIDRRVVRSRITAGGLALLAELDVEIDGLHEQQMGHMDERQLAELRRLTETVTRRPESG